MEKIPGTAPVSAAAQAAALEASALGGLEASVQEGTAPTAAEPAKKARAPRSGAKDDPRQREFKPKTGGREDRSPVNGLSGKRAEITLHDSDRIPPGGQFIGLNGLSFMLLPGIRASVPVELLDVLNDAVMTEPVLNDKLQVDGYRDVPRLTYTFHGLVA